MDLNTQPTERIERHTDGSLDVVDVWYTIQGEGPLSGRPAVFVRLAGCNLQCPLCDTNYTSNRKRHTLQSLSSLVESKDFSRQKLLVVTGGEPMRQNIEQFCGWMIELGWLVQIETNGTLFCDVPNQVRIVCCPKTPKIHPSLKPHAWKYVIQHGMTAVKDGLPMNSLGSTYPPARPPKDFPKNKIYVTPLDVQSEADNKNNRTACANVALNYGYTCNLQMHKVLGLP